MDLGCQVLDFSPGWFVADLYTSLVGQILAVHQHGAFAVERCSVQLAADRQAIAHGRQQIVNVIGGVGLEFGKPALFAPNRGFVHADGHDVELTAFGGDVGGDALAQHTFFQRDPFEGDAGIGSFKCLAVFLHFDHVTVVHGGNDEFRCRVGHSGDQAKGQCQRCF